METFSIGRVMSRGIDLMRSTLGTVGLFTAAIALIEYAIAAGAGLLLNGSGMVGLESQFWPTALISLGAFSLSWAGGVYGLVQTAFHGETSIQECVRVGFAKFIPVAGLLVLWGLGVMLGYMFFVFPAMILLSMWAVTVPAQVSENRSVFDAFGRSRDLTRGYRLQVFALLVGLLVATALFYGFGAGATAFMLGEQTEPGESVTLLAGALALPGTWLAGFLLKAMLSSLYVETFLVREGAPTEQLSNVFG